MGRPLSPNRSRFQMAAPKSHLGKGGGLLGAGAAAAGPAEPVEAPATRRKRRRVHYVNCACGSPDTCVDFELEKGFANLFDSHVAPIAQGGDRGTRAALPEE